MKEFLWVERFAPPTVQECILPEHVKGPMVDIVETMNMQNMIFHSSAGTGKTTCAVTVCKQIGAEYLLINGSDEGRLMETARDRVGNFASSISMLADSAIPKVVIYDEFDNTPQDVQKLLRGSINNFQNTCRFIFTCNDQTRIIDPIHSRCASIDFAPKDATERDKMAFQFFTRVKGICGDQNIPVEDKALAIFVRNSMPDFRKMLNEIQRYVSFKKCIDMGLLNFGEVAFDALFDMIKRRSFREVREWLVSHAIHRNFYGTFMRYMIKHIPSNLIGPVLLISNKYDVMAATAYDQELNANGFLLEIMMLFNSSGVPIPDEGVANG